MVPVILDGNSTLQLTEGEKKRQAKLGFVKAATGMFLEWDCRQIDICTGLS
jgi:hypothetical protein